MNATNSHDARLAAYLRDNGVETVYGLALALTVADDYLRLCDAVSVFVDEGLLVLPNECESVTVAPLFDSAKARWLYTVAALDAAMGNE